MRCIRFVMAILLVSVGLSCDGTPEQTADPKSTTDRLGDVSDADIEKTPVADQANSSRHLRVEDGRFVDAEGRQVVLHGMNIISKSKAENYLSWHRSEDFAAMRAWGMNCIRLGIIWDGIEPQPGKYDEAYLDGVAERIEWASKHGLYVFLDMHQDLFSVLYSDGAPEWATLHEDKPHRKGEVWSDSYLISPAVQTSFDNFWANTPAPDGVGIQDHYAAAWRHVAKRFAGNPTVIGYDIMNEPFPGTPAIAAQLALLKSKFAAMLAKRLAGTVQSPAEILALWQTPKGRGMITEQLEDIKLYTAFVDAQKESSQAFERQQLQPMYQRVADAIRAVDPDSILLLETNYNCNLGVYSGIEPVAGRDGKRDSQQAYAPHGYDIVVDTPALIHANPNRVQLIFNRHGKTAKRLAMPMIVGEWGAFGGADERILPSARVLQRLFEGLLCGDTYWNYGRAIEEKPYFPVLKRSIPCRIAGKLLRYGNDPKTNTFTCIWKETENVSAPTIIYLSKATLRDHSIQVAPPGTGFRMKPASDNSGDVYLTIPPTGKPIQCSLIVN